MLLFFLPYFGYVKLSKFFTIDSCLDKGGSWNYEQNICDCQDPKKVNKSNLANLKKIEHLIINEKCAVIFNPDSSKILIAKKRDEESFNTSAHDAMYYISLSREFLKKQKINIVETESQIIDFTSKEKLITSFNLKTNNKLWGIILFDGKNKPIEIDMTSIDLEFKKFMK